MSENQTERIDILKFASANALRLTGIELSERGREKTGEVFSKHFNINIKLLGNHKPCGDTCTTCPPKRFCNDKFLEDKICSMCEALKVKEVMLMEEELKNTTL